MSRTPASMDKELLREVDISLLRPFGRVLASLKPARAPMAEPGSDEDLETLDRRLSDWPGTRAAGDLVMLAPSDCAPQMPAATFNPSPDAENCGALIADIAAVGGNATPVLVRPIDGLQGSRYALLTGARRHFAVDWLNRNGRSDIRLLAQIASVSDEEAFRIAEHENTGRDDISDLSRAANYRLALDLFYDGVQTRMAGALGMSNSNLNRLLALANLPEAIVAAFGHRDDIKVRHAEVLAPLLRDERARREMLAEAKRIDTENQKLSGADMPLLAPAIVLARLKTAAERGRRSSISAVGISCEGDDVGSIWRNAEGAIQLGATFPPGVPTETLIDALAKTLRRLPR